MKYCCTRVICSFAFHNRGGITRAIAAKYILPHIRLMCDCVLLLTVEELTGLYYCIGSEHAANFLYDLSRLC